MKTRGKVLLAAVVAVLMVLGGAGTAYAAHFQDRALPGHTIGGVPVAGMTRGEVAAVVRDRAARVTVTLDTGTGIRTERLADLGYTVDVDATVDAVFAANASWSSYATSLLASRDVDAVVRTDPTKAARFVTDVIDQGHKAGSDATVSLAPSKTSFVVTPAVTGQTVTAASFTDVVAGAARHLASATTTLRFVDTEPVVTTAEATKVADRANELVARTVAVDDGQEKHKASRHLKASWVTIPTTDGRLGDPELDVAKVRAWFDKVAGSAKVEVRNGVRNVASDGRVLSVYTQARDGRTVSNAATLATETAAALLAGRDYASDFAYDTTPATWTDRRVAAGAEHLAYPAAEGEKWVDVNLSRHTMTAYVGARAVYGPVKMVNGSDKKPTVVGTFQVYLKLPKQTMRGSNADGTKYETPDVPWISYFHNGFALHGAPWRTSFGYAGANGSHGCINLPVPVAKWIYEFATIGTTVTTHN